MSTLIVTNISDGSASVASSAITQGVIKQAVHYNHVGTVGVYKSFGTSSVTDVGVGIALISTSVAFTDASYFLGGLAAMYNAQAYPGSADDNGEFSSAANASNSYYAVTSDNNSNSKLDFSHVQACAFGPLA